MYTKLHVRLRVTTMLKKKKYIQNDTLMTRIRDGSILRYLRDHQSHISSNKL